MGSRWARNRALLVTALAVAGVAAGCGSGSADGSTATSAAPAITVTAGALGTPAAPPSSAVAPPPSAAPSSSPAAPSTTKASAKVDDGPSQAAGDAERDGVLPAVAELALNDRVDVLAELPAANGRTWVLSQLPAGTVKRFGATSSGRLGGPGDGPAAGDYGEVLLVDGGGAIVKAWPMPGAPPNWLAVGPDNVYAGHDGDGGLPDSTLARIDPATLAATVVVVPAEVDGTATGWPADWGVATGDDVFSYRGLIGYGSGGMTGTRAVSTLGDDVMVSLSSIDGLINRVSGATGG